MAVRIRLQRLGKKGNPFYRVVIADSNAKRDGRYIEKIGTYNPMTKEVNICMERCLYWLSNGAQSTGTVRFILSSKGVMLKRHLLEGVRRKTLKKLENLRSFEVLAVIKWIEFLRFSQTDRVLEKLKNNIYIVFIEALREISALEALELLLERKKPSELETLKEFNELKDLEGIEVSGFLKKLNTLNSPDILNSLEILRNLERIAEILEVVKDYYKEAEDRFTSWLEGKQAKTSLTKKPVINKDEASLKGELDKKNAKSDAKQPKESDLKKEKEPSI